MSGEVVFFVAIGTGLCAVWCWACFHIGYSQGMADARARAAHERAVARCEAWAALASLVPAPDPKAEP